VSKAQTLSKLDALLNRVRARAAEPRIAAASAAAPAVHAAPPAPVLAPQVVEEAEDLESTQQRHVPVRGGQRTEAEIVMEVEVEATTTDTVLAVPVEEIQVPEATESRERLVAAEPAAAEPAAVEPGAEREREIDAGPELIASVEVAEADVEEIEEAPASSRRPVAPQPEERLAEMAFGAEEPQPARHTPPPESGRLPAAPPAPVAESAGAAEFEGDVTGVHEASKPVQAPVAIVPEMYSAEIAPSDAVADVVGQAKQPPPETFLAALDASIAL
jgi:hypothetical protein